MGGEDTEFDPARSHAPFCATIDTCWGDWSPCLHRSGGSVAHRKKRLEHCCLICFCRSKRGRGSCMYKRAYWPLRSDRRAEREEILPLGTGIGVLAYLTEAIMYAPVGRAEHRIKWYSSVVQSTKMNWEQGSPDPVWRLSQCCSCSYMRREKLHPAAPLSL